MIIGEFRDQRYNSIMTAMSVGLTVGMITSSPFVGAITATVICFTLLRLTSKKLESN